MLDCFFINYGITAQAEMCVLYDLYTYVRVPIMLIHSRCVYF